MAESDLTGAEPGRETTTLVFSVPVQVIVAHDADEIVSVKAERVDGIDRALNAEGEVLDLMTNLARISRAVGIARNREWWDWLVTP